MVLSPLRRPHDYSGTAKRGGNPPAFSTAHSSEALMKYAIPIRSHRVLPPRPRSRVAPAAGRQPPPCPASPFTPSRKDIQLVGWPHASTRPDPHSTYLSIQRRVRLTSFKAHNLPASAANTGGSVQVAVSKARRAASLPLPRRSRRRASDTALRLRGCTSAVAVFARQKDGKAT